MSSVASLPRPCLIISREANEARRPYTCSRPCAFEEKKNRKNPAPPQTRHEIHSRPATTTNSRRRVAKHVPRVSAHSPASIDPGFVEIGLVQLSQSLKTTNSMSHAHTDKLNNGTLYAPRYEETFLPKGKKRLRSLRSLGLAPLLVELSLIHI